MRDKVRKVEYFSILVADKPGQTFKVLSTLVSAGVNLLACTGFPRGRRSQIDVVPDDSARMVRAAKRAGLRFNPKKSGFLIQGKDRAGALAKNLEKLAEAGVNVTAVDALSAGAGRWAAILWVKPADLRKAGRLLGAKAR